MNTFTYTSSVPLPSRSQWRTGQRTADKISSAGCGTCLDQNLTTIGQNKDESKPLVL